MSTISLRLPDSLHNRARVLAREDGISINQFIASAVAEKMSALDTQNYLEQRAKRGSLAKFRAALAKVPDVAPVESDRLK